MSNESFSGYDRRLSNTKSTLNKFIKQFLIYNPYILVVCAQQGQY